MKTIFDQITDKLRADIKSLNGNVERLLKEIERLEEQNHRLRQELEHKAFQDDF